MRHRLRLWLSLLLLLIGGMVYVLLRPRTLYLFVVADALGLGDFVNRPRAVSEAFQATGLLRGTLDWADVACYLTPYIIYAGVGSWRERRTSARNITKKLHDNG